MKGYPRTQSLVISFPYTPHSISPNVNILHNMVHLLKLTDENYKRSYRFYLNFISRAHSCPRLDWFSFKTESPVPLKSPQTWASWDSQPPYSPVFPLISFFSGPGFNPEHHVAFSGPASLVSSNLQQFLSLSLSFMTLTLLRETVRYEQSESPSVWVRWMFSHE